MKSVYLLEATQEKMRPKPDTNYIQRMQQLADKDEEFTFSVSKDTGRLMRWYDYKDINPNVRLHDDCVDVMLYLGNAFIQLLKNGTWYTHDKQSKNIKDVEKHLFDGKFIVK